MFLRIFYDKKNSQFLFTKIRWKWSFLCTSELKLYQIMNEFMNFFIALLYFIVHNGKEIRVFEITESFYLFVIYLKVSINSLLCTLNSNVKNFT